MDSCPCICFICMFLHISTRMCLSMCVCACAHVRFLRLAWLAVACRSSQGPGLWRGVNAHQCRHDETVQLGTNGRASFDAQGCHVFHCPQHGWSFTWLHFRLCSHCKGQKASCHVDPHAKNFCQERVALETPNHCLWKQMLRDSGISQQEGRKGMHFSNCQNE